MTYRERLERKAEKRAEWASKAQGRAARRFATAGRIADGIPFGQPILVGHHSEGHARADQARIESNMSAGVAESRLAERHEQAAASIGRALDRSVYSDDENAIEALEQRIAAREEQAAGMVALNAAWRKSKGNPATFAELAGIGLEAAQRIAERVASAYNWEKQPVPSWELSNLRATIRNDKQRIGLIKARNARSERAEQAGGVVVEECERGYCRVTFAEKPARSVLDALKVAGYVWHQGSWVGKLASVPEGVRR